METVTVTGPLSPGQPSGSNLATPVESVSSTHGVGSDESPTRTDALEITWRVSSSVTWTYRCPSTLPSATPPPRINRGAGGPLTPPQPTARTANQEEQRSFRIALSSTHLARKRRTIGRGWWVGRRRLLTASYGGDSPEATAAAGRNRRG